MCYTILTHINTLLDLVPDHTGAWCSDTRINDHDYGCTRCDLLCINKKGVADPDYVLKLTFEKDSL